MIEVYKTIEKKLTKIGVEKIREKNSCIYIVSPTPEEIETITNTFDIPRDFIEDPLDINETPRIEREENSTLIIIQTPYYDDEEEHIKFIPLRGIYNNTSGNYLSTRVPYHCIL